MVKNERGVMMHLETRLRLAIEALAGGGRAMCKSSQFGLADGWPAATDFPFECLRKAPSLSDSMAAMKMMKRFPGSKTGTEVQIFSGAPLARAQLCIERSKLAACSEVYFLLEACLGEDLCISQRCNSNKNNKGTTNNKTQ